MVFELVLYIIIQLKIQVVDKTCDVVFNLKLIMPSGLVLIAWVNLSAVISAKCAETKVLIINHTKFAVDQRVGRLST